LPTKTTRRGNCTASPSNGQARRALAESKAAVRQIQLNAQKAGVYVPFTREISEDGGESFSSQLLNATSSALAWGIDDAIISGDGAGHPLGVLHAPSTLVVNKEVGQTAATIYFENIVAMYTRMHPACVANSIWLANLSTLPQLLTMTVATGASGVWYPALQGSGVYSLLGRPLYLSEKCSALGARVTSYWWIRLNLSWACGGTSQ
jgi:HK97 family phage major capsid protein